MSELITTEQAKEWIEYAPKDPGRLASDLAGWTIADGAVCSHCAGRIMARVMSAFRGCLPIWKDQVTDQTCALCGKALQ